MNLAPIGIAIATFEQQAPDAKNPVVAFGSSPPLASLVPVLTHILWGRDVDEALGNLRSHLETDYFFASSFLGEMPWQGGVLKLEDRIQFVGSNAASLSPEDQAQIQRVILDMVREHAQQTRSQNQDQAPGY